MLKPRKMGTGGFVDFLNNNSPAVSAGTNFLSSTIAGIDGADGSLSNAGATASGALSGAGAGTAIMPGIGTAVGAVVGGVGSLLSNSAKKRAAEKETARLEKQRQEGLTRIRTQYDQSILNSFPTEGVTSYGFYKKGGMLPTSLANYLAEDKEVIEKTPGEAVLTDKNGKAISLSSNAVRVDGDKHSAPSGGVGMKGGERVFSDSLEVPGNFLTTLKSL